MAERQIDVSLISPEQRFAGLLLKRKRLEPPADVRRILAEYAEVKDVSLPQEADAIVVNRVGRRPIVFVNCLKPPTRIRFTLAHELGHILIPWHIGTIACHTDRPTGNGDWEYWRTEGEANRFASELLLPREWLRAMYESEKNVGIAFRRVVDTGVSPQAAARALVQVLPPGIVFAVVGSDGMVQHAASSPNSFVRPPPVEMHVDESGLDAAASACFEFRGVHWWRFDPEHAPCTSHDRRHPTVILRDILGSVTRDVAVAERFEHSINGVIGSANQHVQAQSVDDVYSALRQRFFSKRDLAVVTSHKEFPTYLVRRAEELIERRHPGTRALPDTEPRAVRRKKK